MVRQLRRSVTRLACSRAFSTGIDLLESWAREQPNLLFALTYHRVDEVQRHSQLNPRTLSATPSGFAAQMRLLAQRFQVVSLPDVLDAVAGRSHLPPRSVLLTFDDAYVDFAEHAWPILKQLGLPATMFVSTAYPDNPERVFWWDRLHRALHAPSAPRELETPLGRMTLDSADKRSAACFQLEQQLKLLPARESAALSAEIDQACGMRHYGNHVMGWDLLRRLAGEGLSICSHTQTHPLLNRVSLREARREVVEAQRDVHREIGRVCPATSYPDGQFSEPVAEMLAEEGFRLAFTTRRGVNHVHRTHPLRLRRINVGRRTPLALLRAQLLPGTRWLNRLIA